MGNLSDRQFPTGTPIYPQQLAIGSSADTAWVSIAAYDSLKIVLNVGTIASTGTVDMSVWQASDSSGTGAKLISGKSITRITTSNGIAVVNVSGADLDINNGFSYVRAKVVDGTAAAYVSCTVEGAPEATPPAVAAPVVQVV